MEIPDTADSTIELSVVSPAYNEEGNIKVITEALATTLDEIKVAYEIVIVDDGSKDGTWKEICKAAEQYPQIRGIRLARNFGHQHALLSGYSATSGKCVVSIDCDLQHPCELIPQMYQKWKEGFLIVNTLRKDNQVESLFKRRTSDLYYYIFSLLSGVTLKKGASDFRLIDQSVLRYILRFDDTSIFFRGIIEWLGFEKTTAIEYEVRKRHSGKSSYTLSKMTRLALNGILSFSTKPLVLAVWLGITTSLFAFAEILYILVQYFRGVTVPGWASTLGLVTFLFGILFFILGIIGLYLGKIHQALQNRPRFIVSETSDNYSYAKRMTSGSSG